MSVLVVEANKCKVCGCTELSPCVMEELFEGAAEPERLTCTWMDFDHTLCSNIQCVAKIPLNDLLEMPLFRFAMARAATA